MEKNCKTCKHNNLQWAQVHPCAFCEENSNWEPADISPDLCAQGEKRELFEKVVANGVEIKIGDTVYHRSIYEHKEPLRVVGITENALLLEGDYSGGTHNVCQRDWLPLKGTSRVYNHAYKERARKEARTIETLAIPCAGNQDNTFKCMMDMVDAVLVLTSDIGLNPEF